MWLELEKKVKRLGPKEPRETSYSEACRMVLHTLGFLSLRKLEEGTQ